MSMKSNFLIALLTVVFLTIVFSVVEDGKPTEVVTILIQAFWLILVLMRVVLAVLIVGIIGILFIFTSFILEGLNILIHDIGGMEPLDPTFLLTFQEQALDGLEVLYYGFIDFLNGFKISMEQLLDVYILWNPYQSLGDGISISVVEMNSILGNAIFVGDAILDWINGVLGGIGDQVSDFFKNLFG